MKDASFYYLAQQHADLFLDRICMDCGGNRNSTPNQRRQTMNVKVNIGLNIGNTVGAISQQRAEAALIAAGYTIVSSRIDNAGSEPTLVAEIDGFNPNDVSPMYNASLILQQDCIAVLIGVNYIGMLIGPKASVWGTFNHQYFIK